MKRSCAHILGTDFGFSAVVRYSLEGHRSSNWKLDRIPDEEYPRLYGLSEKEYEDLMDSPFDSMLSVHRSLHTRIIEEFQTISDAELELPATF